MSDTQRRIETVKDVVNEIALLVLTPPTANGHNEPVRGRDLSIFQKGYKKCCEDILAKIQTKTEKEELNDHVFFE